MWCVRLLWKFCSTKQIFILRPLTTITVCWSTNVFSYFKLPGDNVDDNTWRTPVPLHAINSCYRSSVTLTAPEEAMCVVCDQVGSIFEQLFCTSCGQHYHGNCLDPPVQVNPIVRAGWQCPECKICQTCRYDMKTPLVCVQRDNKCT